MIGPTSSAPCFSVSATPLEAEAVFSLAFPLAWELPREAFEPRDLDPPALLAFERPLLLFERLLLLFDRLVLFLERLVPFFDRLVLFDFEEPELLDLEPVFVCAMVLPFLPVGRIGPNHSPVYPLINELIAPEHRISATVETAPEAG